MRLNAWILQRDSWRRFAGAVGLMIFAGWLVWTVGLGQQAVSLGVKSAASQTQPVVYEPFRGLPEGKTQPVEKSQAARGFGVSAGTAGLALPVPGHRAGMTVAILGDLAPTNEASEQYLNRAVSELNLLRPDVVLTVGNLLDGRTRSGEEYARQAAGVRSMLDRLAMPWYPCVGMRDVSSGTLDPADRRFVELYQKYFGPRYYSLDCGDVHVIVLDSEEALPNVQEIHGAHGISDEQAAWAKADLARTFEARQAASVLVVVHRPLWRGLPNGGSTWLKIQELLVDFDHKPIVHVEGPGDPGTPLPGPKVVGVFAGSERAYAQDPARDGIPYCVLGATAGVIEQDAAAMVRHYTLVHIDAGAAASPHVALVQMGGGAAGGGILAPDVFLADERESIDRLMNLNESAINLAGAVQQPVGNDSGTADANTGTIRLILANPLTVPIDVEVRLASTRNLSTPTLRENANPYVENFDSLWELFIPYANRHLEPGTHERWSAGIFCKEQTGEIAPPQVEFLVHWNDSRGRTHTVILKRRIPVIPAAEVPIARSVKLDGEEGWQDSYHGGTYSWTPSVYERQKRSPDWEMTADAQNLYLRIRADDDHPSYTANLTRPWALFSDAISIAWAPAKDAAPTSVQRIVVLPFAGDHVPLVLTNNGVGLDQTPLVAIDAKAHPVQVHVVQRNGAWEATIAIPRATIFTPGHTSCSMNIAVHDNDGGAETFVRSWAKEEGGPAVWGHLSLTTPSATPTPK